MYILLITDDVTVRGTDIVISKIPNFLVCNLIPLELAEFGNSLHLKLGKFYTIRR